MIINIIMMINVTDGMHDHDQWHTTCNTDYRQVHVNMNCSFTVTITTAVYVTGQNILIDQEGIREPMQEEESM